MNDSILLYSFDTLPAASAAREELLRTGFAGDDLQLRTADDEAGPVEGNWVIGNGIAMDGSASAGVIGGPDIPYHANFDRTVTRGTCMLQVTLRGELTGERTAASAVVARHGGVDVLARARGARDGGAGRHDARPARQGDAVAPRDRRD